MWDIKQKATDEHRRQTNKTHTHTDNSVVITRDNGARESRKL